jgi:hypothetical protein
MLSVQGLGFTEASQGARCWAPAPRNPKPWCVGLMFVEVNVQDFRVDGLGV